MKVAFLTIMSGTPWGGSEELWSRTALYFRQNDDQVWAGLYRWSIGQAGVAKLHKACVQIVYFDHPVRRPKPFYQRTYETISGSAYERRFNRHMDSLRQFGPDVICVSQGSTFNISANAGVYDFLMATLTPFVIICHHNTEYGGGLSDEKAVYEKQLFDKAATVLFVAQQNLDVAERQLGAKIPRARLIGNPLNLTQAGIRPFKRDGMLRLACVARLDTAVKGQDVLFAALSKGDWPARDFQLTLYGDGADKAYLQRLIGFYGLEDKIFFGGFEPDVDSIWALHDVLVLPSISEGTPLCLIEAMLCGRPALATAVGGVSDYVVEGETGFLAPAASETCLSAALARLWEGRSQLDNLGSNAYARALSLIDQHPMRTLRNILYELTDN